MTKVKVFVYGRRRRRQRQQQQRRRRRGYDNSSPDFRHGELKTEKTDWQRRGNQIPSGVADGGGGRTKNSYP